MSRNNYKSIIRLLFVIGVTLFILGIGIKYYVIKRTSELEKEKNEIELEIYKALLDDVSEEELLKILITYEKVIDELDMISEWYFWNVIVLSCGFTLISLSIIGYVVNKKINMRKSDMNSKSEEDNLKDKSKTKVIVCPTCKEVISIKRMRYGGSRNVICPNCQKNISIEEEKIFHYQ